MEPRFYGLFANQHTDAHAWAWLASIRTVQALAQRLKSARLAIRKPAIVALIVCSAFTWLPSAASSSAEVSSGKRSLPKAQAVESIADIEIDIFSGRPNPKFQLRGDAAGRLLKLFERHRRALSQPAANAGLGFRGFLVRFEQPDAGTYRVLGNIIKKGDSVSDDRNRKVQPYIVSVLSPPMQALVRPLLRKDSDRSPL